MEARDAASPVQRTLERGIARHAASDLDGAQACYLEVLRDVPEHPYALNLLGLADHQRGHHADARALVLRAIARHPSEARFHASLGNILRAEGSVDQAEASYREALSRDASLPEIYNALGSLLLERG